MVLDDFMKNKKIHISIIILLSVFLLVIYLKYPRLDTDIKRQSYALGMQIGNNFKNQKIDYDPEIVTLALRDVLNNNSSKMSVEEIQKALTSLQQGLANKQQTLADKGKKEAAIFLEKNKNKSGVKTTPSGLQYIILKEGEGKFLRPNDIVKGHYIGELSTGEKFDSTYDRKQPAEFRVNTLIRGWSEGMQLIKSGGRIKLFIPPELGYGEIARPGIPAYSVLIIEVELLN